MGKRKLGAAESDSALSDSDDSEETAAFLPRPPCRPALPPSAPVAALADLLRAAFPVPLRAAPLLRLPGDLLERIAVQLGAQSALALLASCRSVFYLLARRTRLWQQLLEREQQRVYDARPTLRGNVPPGETVVGRLIRAVASPDGGVEKGWMKRMEFFALAKEHGIKLAMLPKGVLFRDEDLAWFLHCDPAWIAAARVKAKEVKERRKRRRLRLRKALDGDATALQHPLCQRMIDGTLSEKEHFKRVVDIVTRPEHLRELWDETVATLSDSAQQHAIVTSAFPRIERLETTLEEAVDEAKSLDTRMRHAARTRDALAVEELLELQKSKLVSIFKEYVDQVISTNEFNHVVGNVKRSTTRRRSAGNALKQLSDAQRQRVDMDAFADALRCRRQYGRKVREDEWTRILAHARET